MFLERLATMRVKIAPVLWRPASMKVSDNFAFHELALGCETQ